MTPERAFETMGWSDKLYQYDAVEKKWIRWDKGAFDQKRKREVDSIPREVKNEHEFSGDTGDAWYLYDGWTAKRLVRDRGTSTVADAFVEAIEDEVEKEVRRRRRAQDQAQAELIVEGFSALGRGIGKLFK